MKLNFEDSFKHYSNEEFRKWDESINALIEEYNICTDIRETDNTDYAMELWCYDDDLARLFTDNGIGVGKSFNVEKQFKVDDDYNPVGLEYGDYIESVELHQNDYVYLVPVYCAYNGCGADYAFALFEMTKGE